jgi:hypothetical protein
LRNGAAAHAEILPSINSPSSLFWPANPAEEFNSESQSDTVGSLPLASARSKLPAPTDIALPNKISSREA